MNSQDLANSNICVTDLTPFLISVEFMPILDAVTGFTFDCEQAKADDGILLRESPL